MQIKPRDPLAIDLDDFIPGSQSGARRWGILRCLEHQNFARGNVKDRAKSHRLPARLLLHGLKLVAVEECAEGIERGKHAANAPVENGVVGIDRIDVILLNRVVDRGELQRVFGDIVRRRGRSLRLQLGNHDEKEECSEQRRASSRGLNFQCVCCPPIQYNA